MSPPGQAAFPQDDRHLITPFQAIVRLVREHLAQPGVTITESKFLRDAVLRIDREVDVVIEGEFDGEPVVVSIEVNERGRRAGLPWVQEMIRKHRNLPTNRLIPSLQGWIYQSSSAAGCHRGGPGSGLPEREEARRSRR